ncbi:MAG: energy-coupling factor transporter transmembrane component T [Candidatus ainarchaeum sp.]|nr:energy-coupling factor transporter transmembrane component T [Candidatus ainarchaeum sp.]
MFEYGNKSLFSRSSEAMKIIVFVFFLLLAVFLDSVVPQAFVFAVLIVLLLVSGFRNFKGVFFGLAPFLLLADFGFWFFLSGTPIDLAHLIVVSNLRIFNLVMAAAFFFFSTDVFALVKLMRKLGLPEIVYLPLFALFRFLPELEKDFFEIRDIQKLRKITPAQPAKYLKSLLVPLFITALQKSDELAIAYHLRKKQGRV